MSALTGITGQMTPRASMANIPATDTAQIRELLGMMKVTLGQLGQTFQTLNEQSAKVSTLGPTLNHASAQIQSMRHQIRKQDKKQEARVQEVKTLIQVQLKDQIAKDMKSFISEQIKKETALQVKEQIDVQIKEHIPVTLQEQALQSQKQLIDVRHALMNSEARRTNSNLRTDNLNDTLAIVHRPDGTKSDIYPANLNSLFAYSPEMLSRLLKDYDLVEHQLREKSLNRFMAHIGIPFHLVPVPEGA